MKKILENMIIKWHQAGYALDEIAPLVPQVPKAEIAAIINRCDKETVE
ncbi:antitoxin [Bifidobacterium catenulatum subsp. kashiwanohense]